MPRFLVMSERRGSKVAPYYRLLEAASAEYQKYGRWTDDLQQDLPKRWEKHGDLVLLPQNSFTLLEWRKLGRKLWTVVAVCLDAERVGRKRQIADDDYRTPHIELLRGEHGWVEHVDNGISYHYDVTKCMFSIGNITEKLRIAGFDCKNEVVVDLFAGIGYFTLPYLVHAKASLVHACEWNPDALEALSKNLVANKVSDRCIIHEGDCRQVCPIGVADRVNLGLLPTARAYWLTACKALKSTGGVLHIHENVTSAKIKMKEDLEASKDISVGDSQTVQYCGSVDDGSQRKKSVQVEGQCSLESSNAQDVQKMERKDSLLEAEVDTYYPTIHDDLEQLWIHGKVDSAWKAFSVAASRRIRRFLNNSHDFEWDITILHLGKVKSYGPRIDHIVLDLDCRPRT